MTAQDVRDGVTTVWFVVAVLAIAGVLAWGWPDVKAGWQESAAARATLAGRLP